ncbi:MAG: hypothetical protein R3362_08790, partial [Rhodothermales bacterium]|nr:hypothetical protein [Rhodothermales bacterium]
ETSRQPAATTIPPDPAREEYERTGVVRHARPLADDSVLPALLDDAVRFEGAVRALRERGHHRVPYLCTPAIRAVAHDPNLVGLVKGILGADEPWVMWGANIQRGTPNAAFEWHVDVESWHWPTITVVVGLAGCTAENATRYIPFSHALGVPPSAAGDQTDTPRILHTARSLDRRCDAVRAFEGFGTGRFYAFNARCWHCGDPVPSRERTVLFLHYQRAREPRIPYMKDHRTGAWFAEPAAFIVGADPPGGAGVARTDVYPLPRPHGWRGWLRLPWRSRR